MIEYDTEDPFMATYEDMEEQVEELYNRVNGGLEGALEDGLTEEQFNTLDLPQWLFDLELRRDLRRNIPVNVYLLKGEFHTDMSILEHIYETLVSKK